MRSHTMICDIFRFGQQRLVFIEEIPEAMVRIHLNF